MKPTILVVSREEPELRWIEPALEQAGFSVIRATGLSELHASLMRYQISTVVVHRHTLFLHRIHPVTHLKHAKSRIGIISWLVEEDGKARIRANGGQAEIMARAVQAIERCLAESLISRERPEERHPEAVSERMPDYQGAGQARNRASNQTGAVPLPPCHRKLKLALEAIANAGETGIGANDLSCILWGDGERRRAGDVYSYVSKARKLLEATGANRRIVRFKRRYRIEATGS